MKRLTAILLCAAAMISAAGCSSQNADNKAKLTSKAKTVEDVLNSSSQTAETATSAPLVAEAAESYPELEYTAEVDLTKLDSNMIYSEVSKMMSSPEQYIGKKIKANGLFDVTTDPNSGQFYYACVIKDATACCANGIEFLPKEELQFPNDFPSVNTPIAVGGVFETYKENDSTYCRLKDAEFVYG